MSAMPTADGSTQGIPTIHATTRWSPPLWATLQREVFDALDRAAPAFVARYARPDGTLIWRERWPGMDGSDDPYEGFHNFPLFALLGGGRHVYDLGRTMWEGITRQWTAYGQVHREFDGYYDWMHHGEGYLALSFFGLADPAPPVDRERARRFADFYTGADPAAPNYDPERRIIRAPITGSRGPRFELTAEDWSTHREVLDGYPPPFEDLAGVTGERCPWTDDAVFAQILARMNARMARGDVPLNLTATSLVTHTFLHTGEAGDRRWVLDYLAAWAERAERNGGLIPDNVGPSGLIGECLDGKWWGGYYGWRWPHGWPTIIEPVTIACGNATLLTGDPARLALARSQLDRLWALGREEGGRWVVPHKHRDGGWTAYRPPNPVHPIACWYLSQEEEDLARVERLRRPGDWGGPVPTVGKGLIGNTAPWFEFIRGRNPAYPEQILRANLALIARQVAQLDAEQGEPATWDVHHWQRRTPMICEGLVQLTLGAPIHLYHGGLLHARVRYFDGQTGRAGLPPGVAALVDGLAADAATLNLVNLDPAAEREVIIQAGAFGEHQFHAATRLDHQGDDARPLAVEGRWLRARLAPGAGLRLRLTMRRYRHTPSYATPWRDASELG
jgi:hypothetical protein